jgi:hypothetical protein
MKTLKNKTKITNDKLSFFDTENEVDLELKELAEGYDLKIWLNKNCPKFNKELKISDEECDALMDVFKDDYFNLLDLFLSVESVI